MSESEGGSVLRPDFPSPGSLRAKDFGCKCPSGVNDMGRGNPWMSERNMGQRWIYDLDCTYHDMPADVRVAGVENEPRWLILISKGDE